MQPLTVSLIQTRTRWHAPEANRALFEEMAQVNLGAGAPMRGQLPPWPLVTFLRALYREVTTFLAMAGALVAAAGRMVLHPRRFRLTSTVHQFDRVAWQAVPIILMITFLIGVIIAMLVNLFIGSTALQVAVSVIGVLVFAGLTAYDTQQIKEMYSVNDDGSVSGRKAVMGALRLYLDFINLFMMLLQLFGDRR